MKLLGAVQYTATSPASSVELTSHLQKNEGAMRLAEAMRLSKFLQKLERITCRFATAPELRHAYLLFRQKPLRRPQDCGRLLVWLGCHCMGNAATTHRFQTFWCRVLHS